MSVLLGVVAVAGYFLIGGIAVAVVDDAGGFDDFDVSLMAVLCALWPIAAVVGALCCAGWIVTRGSVAAGERVVDWVDGVFSRRATRLHEQAVKIAAARVLKERRK